MKTTEEIRRQGIEALARELGPVGMARFLQRFENGAGDYVQERQERHDQETAETLKNTQRRDESMMTGNS